MKKEEHAKRKNDFFNVTVTPFWVSIYAFTAYAQKKSHLL
jgi:hypothetical protein